MHLIKYTSSKSSALTVVLSGMELVYILSGALNMSARMTDNDYAST